MLWDQVSPEMYITILGEQKAKSTKSLICISEVTENKTKQLQMQRWREMYTG